MLKMVDNIKNFKRTKHACYFTYIAMSSVFSLPPILFVTFKEMYNISYTLLGTLVCVNFCTQLIIDLIFSFFSKHFNIEKVIKIMPLLTSFGLTIYAVVPSVFPQHAYAGLLFGTVIFSVAAGLCEVLLSPLVAAIPSENPEKDMSLLHSLYAYGVVTVVIISTVFLKLFGRQNWMYLTIFWAILPIVSFVLFCLSPIPEINTATPPSKAQKHNKSQTIILCVICIFLGGAAENVMTNWVSGFIEKALNIPKIWGDILGLATFAILLGIGRTLYAKFGKNISTVLLAGMIGATICYLLAGLSDNVIISMVACVVTGFCTSMLWPGTLILMEEQIPHPGVTAYALMAAGGDFGSSIAPQLMGIIVDAVSAGCLGERISQALSITPEQAGMKVGILTASLFPLVGIFLLIYMKKHFAKSQKQI